MLLTHIYICGRLFFLETLHTMPAFHVGIKLQLMLIVDCIMTNIQNGSLSEIVSSVPSCKIRRDLKFVGCADGIYKFSLFQVYSRNRTFR
jgi:hypothetical protein